MRGRGFQRQPPFISLQTEIRVDDLDFPQGLHKSGFEIPGSGVIRAELQMQRVPGDRSGSAKVGHPVGQPNIRIQCQRGFFQDLQGADINRDGVSQDFIVKRL